MTSQTAQVNKPLNAICVDHHWLQLDHFLQKSAVLCCNPNCFYQRWEHQLFALSDQGDRCTSGTFAEAIKAVIRFRMAEMWDNFLAIVGGI